MLKKIYSNLDTLPHGSVSSYYYLSFTYRLRVPNNEAEPLRLK